MILYNFNNLFNVNTGFSKRCRREVEILSLSNEIVVICRTRSKKYIDYHEYENKRIKLFYFKPFLEADETIEKYKKIPFYEIIRTLDLFFNYSKVFLKVLWRYRKERIKLYSIVSPITFSLINYFWGKFFNAEPFIVEFHDLEPELATHIKSLKTTSLFLKLEYSLEKLVCNVYKNVIVTSSMQAKKITKRTGIQHTSVCVIPNTLIPSSVNAVSQEKIGLIKRKLNIDESKFVVTYISTFTYDYTIKGTLELFNQFDKIIRDIPNIQLLILGDGDSTYILKDAVKNLKLEKYIQFTGIIAEVKEVLSLTDLCIIPWKKDILSENILPTKLFDYMSAKKVIIAPNFGEFVDVLSHNEDALLYSSLEELVQYIIMIKRDKSIADKIRKNSFVKYEKFYNSKIYENKLVTLFAAQ